MLKKLSLKQKLFFLIFIPAIVILSVGFSGVFGLIKVSKIYNHLTLDVMPKIDYLAHIRMRTEEAFLSVLDSTLTYQNNDSKQKQENLLKEIDKEIMQYFERYNTFNVEAEEKKEIDKIQASWKVLHAQLTHSISILNSSDPEALQKFTNNYLGFEQNRKEFLSLCDSMMENLELNITISKGDASDKASLMIKTSSIVVVVGLLVSFILGYMFSRNLSNSLLHLAERLGVSGEQVNVAASSISSSSDSLSAGVTEQAASIQETSASVEELSAMVNKNADNAAKSSDISEESLKTAMEGKSAVSEVVNSINEINDSNTEIMSAVEESNKNIAEITQVINEISQKTKIINDIVFQTKLLSFNASVEAARAGEHGKGFAVVAEEVGNLAEMSGNAAKEISQMLSESTAKVDKIVLDTKVKVEQYVHQGKSKVEHGKDVAQRCNDVLDEVVKNVSSVNGMVKEIALASKEQAQGIHEITRAINQLDQVTQENATTAQSSAVSAENLAQQAKSMHDLLTDLEVTIYGNKTKKVNKVTPVKSDKKEDGGGRSGNSNNVISFKNTKKEDRKETKKTFAVKKQDSKKTEKKQAVEKKGNCGHG